MSMRTSFVPALIFLLIPCTALAQNFVLQSSVVGSGAVNGSSTNFEARGTVGQSAIGTGSSDNFEGSWGFWYTLGGGAADAGFFADLKVFLEGAYNAGALTAALGDTIPVNQPFNVDPWNYGGTESVASGFFSAHPDIVDWIFVQVRDTTPAPTSAPMSVAAERAGFVTTDGSIVDTNGVDPLSFPSLSPGIYYVVVDHRNHLRVMSKNGVSVVSDSLVYDFTDALAKGYTDGGLAMKSLSGGKFGLFAADANKDDQVTVSDFNIWIGQAKAVTPGYLAGDFNLNTQPTTADFNVWLINTKAVVSSQVPDP